MSKNYALELKNISKSYVDGEQEINVLNNISLEVEAGQFVAIVGPSGSGKSTFLSMAGALLSPSSGSVKVGGKELSKIKKKELGVIRREKIGFIFQSHQLLPFLNAREQLTFVSNMNKKKVDKIDADEMLRDLGLDNCAHKYPAKLSGGQKQRIAIARAFMNNPDLILADEPTASLDGERGRQVVELIKKEVKKHNKAAVMVTHDERVLDLVDVIYRIDQGTITKVK